jgi:preprotein translocase subunit SecA
VDPELVRELELGPAITSSTRSSAPVTLTDAGIEKVEELLREAGCSEGNALRHRERLGPRAPRQPGAARPRAVQARQGLHRADGEVIIVDEFTGRMMPGRRWSDGLHQALEAKEGVTIQQGEPDARLDHLPELLPPVQEALRHDRHGDDRGRRVRRDLQARRRRNPDQRADASASTNDEVYRTERRNTRRSSTLIEELRKRGQPVLVGTTSIEKSERALARCSSEACRTRAERQASTSRRPDRRPGRPPGAVTIATNMAGRGTDICSAASRRRPVHPRHRAPRVARASTTSCAAAPDARATPASSRFFLSLEDDLMRIFAASGFHAAAALGMEEGVPIESRMISKRIEAAQKAVETQNFESRKHVLEYDDVMNKQREAVYGLRRQLMEGVDQKQLISRTTSGTILSNILDEHAPAKKCTPTSGTSRDLETSSSTTSGSSSNERLPASSHRAQPPRTRRTHLRKAPRALRGIKEKILGAPAMRYHERIVMLSVLDGLWKDHLLAMDHLKEGIGLRGYAQQDPLVAYKRESFDMFEAMMLKFQEDTARFLFRMQIIGPDGQPVNAAPEPRRAQSRLQPPVASAAQPVNGIGSAMARHRARSHPTRQPSTTIDALEKEFQRKKQRELAAARRAGAGEASQPTQRRTGEKSAATIPAPAAAARNTKSATEQTSETTVSVSIRCLWRSSPGPTSGNLLCVTTQRLP